MSLVEPQFAFARPFWTPERDTHLKALWEKGLIDLDIGRAIGATDRSVCTRRKRLGLISPRAPHWNDEKDAEMNRLWNEGLSATLVARQMGVSRNSVLGRRHRLGLSDPNRRCPSVTAQGPRLSKPTVPRVRLQKLALEEPKFLPGLLVVFEPPKPALPPEPKPDPATILNVKGCRWPVQDHPYLFCNVRRTDTSSYCSEHQAIAFRPAKKALGVE